MLYLKRLKGERICIGDSVVVKVLDAGRGWARIGIVAPPEVAVDREEVRTGAAGRAAKAGTSSAVAPSTRVDRLTARLLEVTEDLAAGADAAESEPEWAALERSRNGVLRAIEELRRFRRSLGGAA